MFAERLKAEREKTGWTQTDVAERIGGISTSAYARYELGKREPDFSTLLKLSDLFGVTTDYLLRGTPDKQIVPAIFGLEKSTFYSLQDLKDLRDGLGSGRVTDIPAERIPFIVDWLTKEIFFIEMLNNTKKTSR